MAGGSGTRLWPASTSARPKQFLKLPGSCPSAAGTDVHDVTFFGAAITRACAVTKSFDEGRVLIVAGRKHTDAIVKECAKLGKEERSKIVLLPEPLARNTAPAISCALRYIDLTAIGSARNVLVLTSDHIISPLETFIDNANAASVMAEQNKFVVFGIPPSRPETGYGYIEAAEALPSPQYTSEVFSVASFQEKPNAEKAQHFIDEKRYYWNSGMFAFSSQFMLAEFQRSAPNVIGPFAELKAPDKDSYLIKEGLHILNRWQGLDSAYESTLAISLDYAIAEHCKATVMVKADFSWTDVGSWDEYSSLAKNSGSEVYASGTEGETCFVNSDIPVALCGVEDLIVVVRSGKDGGSPSILISKKGKTQAVKNIVEKIKSSGRTELL